MEVHSGFTAAASRGDLLASAIAYLKSVYVHISIIFTLMAVWSINIRRSSLVIIPEPTIYLGLHLKFMISISRFWSRSPTHKSYDLSAFDLFLIPHIKCMRANMRIESQGIHPKWCSAWLRQQKRCVFKWSSYIQFASTGQVGCLFALVHHRNEHVTCLSSDINSWMQFGNFPLHEAAAKNHVGVVQYLLQKKANATLQNKVGDIFARSRMRCVHCC